MDGSVFPEKLKELRKKRGYTLIELAKKSGVAKSAISYYERGVRIPKPDTIERLATALDVSSHFLAEKDTLGTIRHPIIANDGSVKIEHHSKVKDIPGKELEALLFVSFKIEEKQFKGFVSMSWKEIKKSKVIKEDETKIVMIRTKVSLCLPNKESLAEKMESSSVSYEGFDSIIQDTDIFQTTISNIDQEKMMGIIIPIGYSLLVDVFPDLGIELNGGGHFRYKTAINWLDKLHLEYFSNESNVVYLIDCETIEEQK